MPARKAFTSVPVRTRPHSSWSTSSYSCAARLLRQTIWMPSSALPFLPDFAMTRCPLSSRRYANNTPGRGKLQVPMPRYVILAHDHPFPHWDLMLERDASLRTWRLATLPKAGEDVG